MSKYPVEFVITPAQMEAIIAASPEMAQMIQLAIMNGVTPEWSESLDGTRYKFLPKGAERVPGMVVAAMLQFGVHCILSDGIWIEVADSAMDNLVPTSWPNSKIVVDDGEGNITETRRAYQDVTQITPGKNGTSLLRCRIAEIDEPFHYETQYVETAYVIGLYQAAFPDSAILYRSDLSAWLAANVSAE